MLVDLVLLNDEVKLLAFRLKYLSQVVDRFVVFESTKSFSGRAKNLLAREAVNLSQVNEDKVSIVEYSFPEDLILDAKNNRWPLERYARAQLETVSDKFPANTKFIVSDLDEIPSIYQLREAINDEGVILLPTPLFYRFANWAVPHGNSWKTAKVIPREHLVDLNLLRYETNLRNTRSESGCHFSYLGSTDLDLFNKLRDIAHSELSLPKSIVTKVLRHSNDYFLDHLGRFNRKGYGLLKEIDLSNFSDVQRNLYEFNPEFFEFRKKEVLAIQRLFASFKLWLAWRSNNFDLLEAKFRGFLALKFLFFLSKFWLINNLTVSRQAIKRIFVTSLAGEHNFVWPKRY